MSLDQNLFTLLLTPNTTSSGLVTDLTDPSGNVHYRKRRVPGQVYRIEVYDPVSDSLLASATAPSATSKHKTVELYNPSKVVELKYTGTLTFRWSFKWEEHQFEWKREECFMIRKPDPPVLVAVTKEPPGRIKTSSVQILDYNLNRFDIEDRKGLEIVILTALLTFQDASDSYHEPAQDSNTTALAVPSALRGLTMRKASGKSPSDLPPVLPPKPAAKKGIQRIAEIQAARGKSNEVLIVEECAFKDYAQHCVRLLQDEAMLFISIRSSDAPQVPKAVQVVEETKRIWHKAGEKALYQYVLNETVKIPLKGPKRINVDGTNDKGKGKDHAPPSNIVVHLSKIDMPELRPKRSSTRAGGVFGTWNERTVDGKKKEIRRDQKGRDKEDKEKKLEKEQRAKLRSKSSLPVLSSHVGWPSQGPHVHPHRSHPHEPSAPSVPPRMPVHRRLATAPNRHSTYETYPVAYRVYQHPSSARRPESPDHTPPSSRVLLGRLLGK